jgi:hypothetical protein
LYEDSHYRLNNHKTKTPKLNNKAESQPTLDTPKNNNFKRTILVDAPPEEIDGGTW